MDDKKFVTPWLLRLLRIERTSSVDVNTRAVAIGSLSIAHDEPGEWSQTKKLFWIRVTFAGTAGIRTEVFLSTEQAEEFMQVCDAWRARVSQNDLLESASRHLKSWKETMQRWRYVPRHEVAEWLKEAEEIHGQLYGTYERIRTVDPEHLAFELQKLMRDPWAIVHARNDDYVRRELQRTAKWFEGFKVPPTNVQREVAIRDETNALVVAGAGTGKTSTIVTKIRYLLEAKHAAAAGILVVAFNTDAAREIRERCEAVGCEGITVLTFHALGLRILAEQPGEKPPVLSELETEAGRDDLIARLVDELCREADYGRDYARFLLLYARPALSEFEADSERVYVARSKAMLSKSLHGDWVRSTQELRIANWLHLHGVEYEYEKPYPHRARGSYKRYQPDFTIRFRIRDAEGNESERVVYLEHQALNERGEAPAWMKNYARKIAFCRGIHAEHQTILVESFSWWFSRGIWEDELRKALAKVGLRVPDVDWRARLAEAETQNSVSVDFDRKMVNGLIRRVLDLSRATDARQPSGNEADAARAALFRRLFQPVQAAYEAHKRRREGIDFEDMISLARQVVARGGFAATWTHYIIDEFQDASLSRLDLILGLRRQAPDSRLTCVGDDWQAIIRFAGGDIRVMTEFGQRVGTFWQANLDQAFRYSETIAEVSADFVLANPQQLVKQIQPAAQVRNRPVRIVMAGHKSGENELNDVLFEELERIEQQKENASVMVLGRYRRSIPAEDEQQKVRARFPHLKVEWSTVHRAKGREADAVILGDLHDGAWGFPCLREDDPILREYLPPADVYEHAEERRLFYVALTRAREFVVLISDGGAPSPFILELMLEEGAKRGRLEVVNSGERSKPCPRCKVGYVVARDGPHGLFYACTKSPACSHTENACPTCRQGFLEMSGDRFRCSRVTEGCQHSAAVCPQCRVGMLELRTNRQHGNQFWGCSRFFDEENSCNYTKGLAGQRRW